MGATWWVRDTAGRSSPLPWAAVEPELDTSRPGHQTEGWWPFAETAPIPVQHGHPLEWKLHSKRSGISTHPTPTPTHRGGCLLGASHHSFLLPGASFKSSLGELLTWTLPTPTTALVPQRSGHHYFYHLDNVNPWDREWSNSSNFLVC